MSSKESNKTGEKQDTKFKPGMSGNPKGRPKGSFSIKDSVRKYLQKHPEEFSGIIQELAVGEKYRELMWKMLEGNPPQSIKGELEGEIKHKFILETGEQKLLDNLVKEREKKI